jgi:hypothetical protein
MPYPHSIGLAGPWQCHPIARYLATPEGGVRIDRDNLPAAARARMPNDWQEIAGADFRGIVRHVRRFHRPTGLEPHERVWLVSEGVDSHGQFTLNGQSLGRSSGYAIPAEFDITDLLQDANDLTIDIELSYDPPHANATLRPGREKLPGGLIAPVRLEIRSEWTIERPAVWVEHDSERDRLFASGTLHGPAREQPLSLLVNAAGREVAYRELQAGEKFLITGDASDLPTWPGSTTSPDAARDSHPATVEVKLIAGGTAVWETRVATARPAYRWKETPAGWQCEGFAGSIALSETPQPGRIVVTERVLSQDELLEAAAAGCGIVQSVPLAWAEVVCAARAHLPSLVAWAARQAELQATMPERLAACSFGRPWLAIEEILATR